MARLHLLRDDNTPLDAHFEVLGGEIVVHSRGGTRRRDSRNSDYTEGLSLLIRRLADAGHALQAAWVDSSKAKALPLEQRRIFSPVDEGLPAEQIPVLLAQRMSQVGRKESARGPGNRTKRIRLRVDPPLNEMEATEKLYASAEPWAGMEGRLAPKVFDSVTAEHIWNAVQKLRDGFTDHPFGECTTYDVLTCQPFLGPAKS